MKLICVNNRSVRHAVGWRNGGPQRCLMARCVFCCCLDLWCSLPSTNCRHDYTRPPTPAYCTASLSRVSVCHACQSVTRVGLSFMSVCHQRQSVSAVSICVNLSPVSLSRMSVCHPGDPLSGLSVTFDLTVCSCYL